MFLARVSPGFRIPSSLLAVIAPAVACTSTPASTDPAPAGLESRPLQAPSHALGSTLFATLDAPAIGIITENRYADPDMWGERYQEFALGAIGTGVAIGDFDNDGSPDVFVVSKTERARLFRNLGTWRFEDVTERAGLIPGDTWTDPVEAWKQGAAFADVNNDGWLDLYVARFRAPNLLFINQRDGTFREEGAPRGLGLVDASCTGAFCDYDRDGWLDVYVQTNMLDAVANPDGRRDRLYRNTGDGFFTDVSDAAGVYGDTLGHSAIWWDYDADGWPDLYVANDFATPDRLYHNNRDGTFTDRIHKVVPQQPLSSMGSDLGDIDNDGRMDFLVADMAATSHIADQRGMASARNPVRVDNDQPGIAPQYLRNTLYLNTGTGHMLEAAYLAGLDATDWTWTVRFEDLDNDGRLDLYITNGMNREHQNADMRFRIFSAANLADRLRIMRDSPLLAEANLAFRNLGDLRFQSVGPAWGLDLKGVSFGAAFGDLDGDGDLDIVHTNYEAPATILRNDADSGHRLVVALRGTRSNRFGVGATVRLESAASPQVRTLVLARGYLSTSEPVLHFGLGDDARVQRLTVSWPSGHTQTFSDIAADQHLTITEPEGAPDPGMMAATATATPAPALFADISEARQLALPTREKPLRETGQQPLIPFTFARRGPALAVADLDGDAREDIVLGGTTADPARLLGATAAGIFVPRDASTLANTTTLDDGPLLAFDADGDGDQDILSTRAGTLLAARAAP
ncbi:MAG: CRTAC1 family protein, partial [Opitutaceae bacterium]|nr:CRTAC1 family protein [Opitutaceae bacterium]